MKRRTTRRKFSRGRGAVMAEVVITLPVTLVLWKGIDYFRGGYMARIDALSQARNEAFSLAHDNTGKCFAGGTPWEGFKPEKVHDLEGDTVPNGTSDPGTGDNPAPNTGDGDQAGTTEDADAAFQAQAGGPSASTFLYAHALVHATRRPPATPDQAQGDEGLFALPTLQGQAFVTCNEQVPDRNGNVFVAMEAMIKSFIGGGTAIPKNGQ
jgi:hypothetical protein